MSSSLRALARNLNPGGRFEDEHLGIAGMVWSEGPYPNTVWVVRDDGICQVVRLTRGIPHPYQLGETYVPTGCADGRTSDRQPPSGVSLGSEPADG